MRSRGLLAVLLALASAAMAQPPSTGGEDAVAAARPADPYSGVVVNDFASSVRPMIFSRRPRISRYSPTLNSP